MKNTFNKIEKNLKAGIIVVVKDLTDHTYCTILNSKDAREGYRYSGWYDSIKEAKQSVGNCSGYAKEYWNYLDLEIVEVYRPEYKPFKIGDKVRILDSIKKTENWENVKEYFPDMTGEIKEVFFKKIGTHYFMNNCWIGHEYLAPLQEVRVSREDKEEIKEERVKVGSIEIIISGEKTNVEGAKKFLEELLKNIIS
jgi:hypothetical protein